MELLETIGTRRSIRFFKPWKEVEDWKIQRMLQASRYASCQGNCGSTEASVIDKKTYPEDELTAMAKVLDVKKEALAEIKENGEQASRAEDLLRIEAGQAIAHSLLAATELGLGCCLLATGRKPAEFPKVLGVPDNIVPLWLMAVGYAAESPGQRPRKRFDRLYHSNVYGNYLKEDPEVRQELRDKDMIQPSAPLPGRDEELRHICRMFGFTEDMPDMPKEKIRALYQEDSIYYGEVPPGLEDKGV